MNASDWPTFAPESSDGGESHLDINRALWGRKWLLVFLALVGAGLGYLQYSKTPPTYASSVRVAVEWNRPPIRVDNDGAPSGYNDPLQGHIARILSPVVLDIAVEESGSQLTSLSSIGTANPMAALLSGLQVVQDEENPDILRLSFSGSVREDCPRVLNIVISAYETYLSTTQSNSAKEAVDLITQLKDGLILAIEVKEKEYAEFRDNTKLLWTGTEGLNIHTQRLTQIESTRAALLLDRVQKQSRADSIRTLMARGENREALMMVLDQLESKQTATIREADGKAGGIAGDLMQAEIEREMLLTQGLAEGHPKIKQLDKRMELLKVYHRREQDLAAAASAAETDQPVEPQLDILQVYLESLQHELAIIDDELAGLNKSFEAEESAAKALVEEENLNRSYQEDLERKKSLFEMVLGKLESIELTGSFGGFKAKKMEEPGLGAQVAPNLTRYASIGGVLGMLVALAISVAIEMTDRSFRDPSQVAKLYGVPVVGHVPSLDVSKDRRLLKDSPVDPTVVTYHRPSSRQAEAFRNVRAALLMGAQSAHRVVQVTSPNPGDGKTTLSSNLAVAIAKSGKRCLLVDCDFRRPRVHRVFGLSNSVGLSTIITEGTDLPDATYTGGIPDLDIVPAGPRTENPGELLLSPRFASFLQMARDRYDFVVVDTPPVLAVSDASAVAAMVDGVLLTTRIARDNRPLATRAKQTLELVGGRLLGIVVNAVEELSGYGSYTGYASNYSRYNNSRSYGKYYTDEPRSAAQEWPEAVESK